MHPLHPFLRSRGVTLTEVMIVIAIIGILAGIAVPSYQDMIERNRLKQAAESLADDLKFARTEAIKRGGPNVTLTLTGEGTKTWSYTLQSGGVTFKTVQGSQFEITKLIENKTVTFSFLRGAPNATIRPILQTTKYQAAVDVSIIGKVTICTPSGQTGLPNYAACLS